MTEAELKLVNSGLFALSESMDLLAVGIRRDGTIFYVNNYLAILTGYTKAEILDKSWFDLFISQKIRENVRMVFERMYIDTFHKDYINAIVAKDGKEIEVDWNNAAITNDNLELVGTFSIGVEIVPRNKIFMKMKEVKEEYENYTKELEEKNETLENSKKAMLNILEDQKVLEDELVAEKRGVEKKIQERTIQLKEEQAKLLASLNSIPLGFAIADHKGNLILTNNSLEEILGIKEQTWTLDRIDKALNKAYSVYSMYQKCTSTKQPQEVNEILFDNKYLSIYMAPVFISHISSEIIGTIIILSDITEMKVIERSKDEFVTIASHELRTPLAAIRGNIELLRKYFKPEAEASDILTDLHSSTLRLIDLVNDFLTTSRLEQGKLPFEKTSLSVDGIITETVKEFEQQVSSKGLFLKYERNEKTTPAVLADKMRLHEILLNLIENAIKFTTQGGITIKTSTTDKILKISVQDTGKGVEKELQSLVFRKFQQASPNILVRDYTQGSGLGLYISKLMVEGMGGKIYLEKSDGKNGATFSFEIPLA